MSEKKRKRQENGDESQPNKKSAIENSTQSIKVSHVEGEEWAPILGKFCTIVRACLNLALISITAQC